MKRHCLLLIIPALLLCAATALAGANTPDLLIPYQKSVPTLASTGTITFSFKLFDAATGGSAVWVESKPITVNATKVISTKLGETAGLELVDFSKQMWVEVSNFDTNVVYGTRDKLVIGPYAFWSKSVAAGAITGSSLASMGAASGQVLGYNGTTWAPVNAGGSGTVTSVGLALPDFITVSGGPVTTTGTLTGTLAGQLANRVFAAPNGASGTPIFRALVAADIPTLNQSTTGTAANVTGIVALANGGTGATTQVGAAIAVLPSQSGKPGYLLKTDGTNVSWIPGDAVKAPITGNLTATPNTITDLTAQYTGSTITLSPGKWNVQVNMMMSGESTCNVWVRTTFSDNAASIVWSGTYDIVGSSLASGLNIEGNYGGLMGSIIINNTSGANKTYYYWVGQPAYTPPCTYKLTSFGTSLWGEDQMIAFPMTP